MDVQTLTYHGTTKKGLEIKVDVSFLLEDEIMINATEMAKPFGLSKKPDNWLRSKRTNELIEALTASQKREASEIVRVENGNNGGTWLHQDLAFHYALYLDAHFAIWVGKQIKTLLQKGKVELDPNMLSLTADNYQTALERKGLYRKRGYEFNKILENSNPLQLFLTFQSTIVNNLHELTAEEVERQFESLQRTFKKYGYSLRWLNDNLNWKKIRKQLLGVVKNYNRATDFNEKEAYQDVADGITQDLIEKLKKEKAAIEEKAAEIQVENERLTKELATKQTYLPLPQPKHKLDVKSLISRLTDLSKEVNHGVNNLTSEFQKREALEQELEMLREQVAVNKSKVPDQKLEEYKNTIKYLEQTIQQLQVKLKVRETANDDLYEELERAKIDHKIDFNTLNTMETQIPQFALFEMLMGREYTPTVNDRSLMSDLNKKMTIIEKEQGVTSLYYETNNGKSYRKYRLGAVVQALINASKKRKKK